MHERHVKKDPRHPGQLQIFMGGQGLQRELPGACIAGEGLRSAAKHVAAELVEQNDQRQPALGLAFPVLQRAADRLHNIGAKARPDFFVKRCAAQKPALVQVLRGPALRHAVAQPESKNVGGGGCGGGGCRG